MASQVRQERPASLCQQVSSGSQAFRKDIPPGDNLDGAAKVILNRFLTTDDTLGRILAGLRKPTPNDYMALQQFVQRFLSRVDPALQAYEQAKKRVPTAATH